MCPHVGDLAAGFMPGLHAVPGPVQVNDVPSPAENTTFVGVAVAVTDMPGTDAVAVRGPHDDGSSHTQLGNRTNCATGGIGFNRIAGAGGRSAFTACSASSASPGGEPNKRNLVKPTTGG